MKYLFDYFILFLLYIFIFYKIWKRKSKRKLFFNTIIYIYISFVLYYTLMPIFYSLPTMFDHPYRSMNLIPFIDVKLNRGNYIKEIVLNIFMTIPFGFLFPYIINEKFKFLKTIISCFLLSLCIELLQPLLSEKRSSDITDLITNVIGGIIGYSLYIILSSKFKK